MFRWLCGIARHKAADLARRQGRVTQSLEARNGSSEDDCIELLDSQPLPEELAIRGAGRAAVVGALWSLPEDYRRALILRYGRGERIDQVASHLQRSYKAVEALLVRARAALRQHLLEVDSRE